MKLRELIYEAGEFKKFYNLGKQPVQLAKHVMGKPTSGAASKPAQQENPALAATIDRVLSGEQLNSQDIQNLKALRKTL